MVQAVRACEKTLGSSVYRLSGKSVKNREFRKSLFIGKDIKEGEVFTAENLKIVRPGFGLHPKYYEAILGKKATKAVEFGTPMRMEFVNLEQDL